MTARDLRLISVADRQTPDRSRVWHPSAASGEAGRVVMVGVKSVDEVAARAGEYAQRIPAASHRGVHATAGSGAERREGVAGQHAHSAARHRHG